MGASAAMPEPAIPYLETAIENGSPVWWEIAETNTVIVHLVYDHERGAPNRAAGHVHFVFHASSGTTWSLVFTNLDNVWNGRLGNVAKEMKVLSVSADGSRWEPRPCEMVGSNSVRLDVAMPGPHLHVARIEPYRLSDLDRLLVELRGRPEVAVQEIGRTAEGRPLEIVRIGADDAPRQFFLRARAHPWESGGNWVVQGLIRRLLAGDAAARRFLSRGCVHILPMANKDGVARGRTRFNARGRDLNRQWDQPADPDTAPENHALERWLIRRLEQGRRLTLAIDLHNDGSGRLHISRPEGPAGDTHVRRMAALEQCLRDHTWFTEGSTPPTFRNPGSLGEGWVGRFGVDAVVLELNCNWAAGRAAPPTGAMWEELGAGLVEALEAYGRWLDNEAPPATP